MTFLEMLDSRGIPYKRSVSDPNEVTLCCIKEGCGDTRYRLGVNIFTMKGHCFNCGWRSRNAPQALAEMLLFELPFIDPEDQPAPNIEEDAPKLPEDFTLLWKKPTGSLYRKAWEYLRRRHITTEQMREKKMGVSFIGQYAYRIIIPVYYDKTLVGLVTRDFTGQQEPKYLNTRGMKTVYNIPVKKKAKVILTEGIFDVYGIERALKIPEYDVGSLLGHDLTEQQKEMLESYRDVVMWPDADVEGVKGFIKVAKELADKHRMFFIPPSGYEGKDTGEMEVSDIRYLWATRTRFTDSVEMRMRTEVAFAE